MNMHTLTHNHDCTMRRGRVDPTCPRCCRLAVVEPSKDEAITLAEVKRRAWEAYLNLRREL